MTNRELVVGWAKKGDLQGLLELAGYFAEELSQALGAGVMIRTFNVSSFSVVIVGHHSKARSPSLTVSVALSLVCDRHICDYCTACILHFLRP